MIFQYHFTSWPDFGVPKSPVSFYEFVELIRNSECHSLEYGPLISHCRYYRSTMFVINSFRISILNDYIVSISLLICLYSAGIGRSGTYCLVNLCLLHVCFVINNISLAKIAISDSNNKFEIK